MTGRTRDYLADLANRKGVKLPGGQERDQAWASDKIDELKRMNDRIYFEVSPEQAEYVAKRLQIIISGINAWTFEAS